MKSILAIHKGYDFGFPPEGEHREKIRGCYPCKPEINKCPFDKVDPGSVSQS